MFDDVIAVRHGYAFVCLCECTRNANARVCDPMWTKQAVFIMQPASTESELCLQSREDRQAGQWVDE